MGTWSHSRDLLDPEASAAVVCSVRVMQRSAQQVSVRSEGIGAAEQDPEAAAVHQQGANDVLFVPAPVVIERPCLRIIVGQEDVVEVDPYSLAQPGEHLETQM